LVVVLLPASADLVSAAPGTRHNLFIVPTSCRVP
jgi:hypothetical protein